MKQHILTIAAAALLSIPTLTIAQDRPAGDRPGRGQGGAGGGGRGFAANPEERIKRMTEQLGLTQEQQDKIKGIYAKQAETTKALQEKGRDNWTDEDRTKMRESFTKTQEEVNAVLTPEQKKKQEESRPQRGQGGPGGGGFAANPEERIKRMTEQLSLTQEQQDKIKGVYAKQAETMKALQEKGRDNWTDEDRTKMRESFTKTQEEVNAVLTPEQKKKLEESRPQRGQGGPGGRGEGRPAPGGAPKPEEKK